ncbi:MAG: polysaccharide pyruvyl transferase family protein [Verrucomicrobiota bacterium]
MNPWLWSRLAPEVCDAKDPTLFLAIGTILSPRVPAEPRKVVFGSGCGQNRVPVLDHKWSIYGVRGPRTAAMLGLEPSLVLTDPAILVRRIPLPPQEKRFRFSLMLHHQSSFEADWAGICRSAGVHFIDPRVPVEQVLAEIQQTELLVTEALHGAVVADALRIPWIPVRLYGQFVEFKWLDWSESLEIPLKIASLPSIYQRDLFSSRGLTQSFKALACAAGLGKTKWRKFRILPSTQKELEDFWRAFNELVKNTEPCLSAQSTIQRTDQRLFETLARIREDWVRRDFKPRAGR